MVVISAGATNLMAARVLLLHKRSLVVLEARRRKGERAFSFPMPESGSCKFTTILNSPIAEEAPLDTRRLGMFKYSRRARQWYLYVEFRATVWREVAKFLRRHLFPELEP